MAFIVLDREQLIIKAIISTTINQIVVMHALTSVLLKLICVDKRDPNGSSKSPRVTGIIIIFLVRFRCRLRRRRAATAVLPTLFDFPGKSLKLISSNPTWLTYGCLAPISVTLDQGH